MRRDDKINFMSTSNDEIENLKSKILHNQNNIRVIDSRSYCLYQENNVHRMDENK